MQNELIKIYRLDNKPIEIERDKIIWIDRSRLETGLCPRHRYLAYDFNGLGYSPTGRNQDFVIGSTVHEGCDVLLQGGSIEQAFLVMEDYYYDQPPFSDAMDPDQADILTKDGIFLAKGLVYSFYSRYLSDLLSQYDVLEVEEEINWLIGENDNKFIVMMSRNDGVLRSKESGKIWTLSHKTTSRYNHIVYSKLEIDMQRFSESLAVEAKFKEEVEGTLYNYFDKGEKRLDNEYNIKRHDSGLIRPYINRMGIIGDINPELLHFQSQWTELENGKEKVRKLGKGWERCSIYDEMDYEEYLKWLEDSKIPRHKDYLHESVVGLIPQFYNKKHSRRWLNGLRREEILRSIDIEIIKIAEPYVDDIDSSFPLKSSECYNKYNNGRCIFYENCWHSSSIIDLESNGLIEVRKPNHKQEIGEYNI